MTQPQQPFGEARACGPDLRANDPWPRHCPRRFGHWCAPDAGDCDCRVRWSGGPLRETAETVDAAELLKRQAAQIGALQVRVGVQDARIAALDDDCRRLRAEVERLGQAQAV